MNNNDVVKAVVKRVAEFNDRKTLPEEKITIGYKSGKGFYFTFQDNWFARDRNLVNNNQYINLKNYSNVGFILNKYEEYLEDYEIEEDTYSNILENLKEGFQLLFPKAV